MTFQAKTLNGRFGLKCLAFGSVCIPILEKIRRLESKMAFDLGYLIIIRIPIFMALFNSYTHSFNKCMYIVFSSYIYKFSR